MTLLSCLRRRTKYLPSLEISPLFFLVLSYSLFLDNSGVLVSVILTVILHELGHALAMLLFHIPIQKIHLRGFGMELVCELPQGKPRALIMLAGPLFNLLTAAFLLLTHLWLFPFGRELFVSSLFLGVFHLLPVKGFDGANALLSLSLGRKIICFSTYFLLFLFFVLGILLLFCEKNVSLLILSLWLMGNIAEKN